jgi:hypothetical protein
VFSRIYEKDNMRKNLAKTWAYLDDPIDSHSR